MKKHLIIAILLFACNVWAANVYVNDQCGAAGNGSNALCSAGESAPLAAMPWGSLSNANDYYAACGHDESINSGQDISLVGTSGNHVIFGAFDPDTGVVESATLGGGTFGTLCADGSSNKPIFRNDDDSEITLDITAESNAAGAYIEIQNWRIINGSQGIHIRDDYVYVKYAYIEGVDVGITMGKGNDAPTSGTYNETGDNNYIGYTYISADGDGTDSTEGIEFALRSDDSTAEYNTIVNFEHNGIQVENGATGILAHFNKAIYTTYGGSSNTTCYLLRGDGEIFSHNYCLDGMRLAGIPQGSNKEFDHNVCVDCDPTTGGVITLQALDAGEDIDSNKIFNNGAYYTGTPTNDFPFILVYGDATGELHSNLFANNIVIGLDTTDPPYWVSDPNNVVDSTDGAQGNEWYNNNSCPDGTCGSDGHVDDYIATIESGNNYVTAANWNAHGTKTANNTDNDPGIDSVYTIRGSSNVFRGGYTVTCTGTYCSQGFNHRTDFSTNPMRAGLGKPYTTGTWPIGPFDFWRRIISE
jgi:hypothetical protein